MLTHNNNQTTTTNIESPYARALAAMRRTEAALPGHDVVVACIDVALAAHASAARHMTVAFLERIREAEKRGAGANVLTALTDAADVALAHKCLRFDAEVQRVREALAHHLLTTALVDGAAPKEAVAAAEEARGALAALFADDAHRAAALRAALDARAERAKRRRRAVVRAVARLPRSSSV